MRAATPVPRGQPWSIGTMPPLLVALPTGTDLGAVEEACADR